MCVYTHVSARVCTYEVYDGTAILGVWDHTVGTRRGFQALTGRVGIALLQHWS